MKNIPKEFNEKCKEELLAVESITKISKALVHFAFRNGPIEEMHGNNQLSDKDMKTLNKFMVNRLAYVFNLIIEEEWFEFLHLINYMDKRYGIGWDAAIPDDGENTKSAQAFVSEAVKNLQEK